MGIVWQTNIQFRHKLLNNVRGLAIDNIMRVENRLDQILKEVAEVGDGHHDKCERGI